MPDAKAPVDSGSEAVDSGGPVDAGPPTNGTWTQVVTLPSSKGKPATVSGMWFSSVNNGVVSFADGAIEHLDGPMHVDTVALDGKGKLPGPSDDGYLGFFSNPDLGLVAVGSTSKTLIISSDNGKSFTYGKTYGTTTTPVAGIPLTAPMFWAGKGSDGNWHVADKNAGVWSSPAKPSDSADFTITWHPMGVVTVPATIPAGDCHAWVSNGYFSELLGQSLAVTPDGKTIVYGGVNTDNAICRSTDGGKTFVNVSKNVLPASFSTHYQPWIFQFASNTVGIAAYGSDVSLPESAYVLYTTDAGLHWTQGKLPPSAANTTALIGAFASPTGTLFLVGAGSGLYQGPGGDGESLLVYKSTDGGQTWKDLSVNIAQWAKTKLDDPPLRLATGFALDDQHIWVGGGSFVAYSATGGE